MKPSDVFFIAWVYCFFDLLWSIIKLAFEVVWIFISAIISAGVQTLRDSGDDWERERQEMMRGRYRMSRERFQWQRNQRNRG